MTTCRDDTTSFESRARPGLLGRAVGWGFAVGAFALGTFGYFGADDSSLVFSPEEQAMVGAVIGAIGGALAGLLLWTMVLVADLARLLIRRASNHEAKQGCRSSGDP